MVYFFVFFFVLERLLLIRLLSCVDFELIKYGFPSGRWFSFIDKLGVDVIL